MGKIDMILLNLYFKLNFKKHSTYILKLQESTKMEHSHRVAFNINAGADWKLRLARVRKQVNSQIGIKIIVFAYMLYMGHSTVTDLTSS